MYDALTEAQLAGYIHAHEHSVSSFIVLKQVEGIFFCVYVACTCMCTTPLKSGTPACSYLLFSPEDNFTWSYMYMYMYMYMHV